jgi:phosphopantothenoylcysteine decarboxylase/phosphopantothenate--cysteine ligase
MADSLTPDIWSGKSVLLGVTGGVAIYKAVVLASRLAQRGAEIDVVMTPAAEEFVRPLQFAAVTHRPVYGNPWKSDRKPEHIALAQRPDLIILAPCTANTMAKIAMGIADNLLTSVLLAAKKPVLIAPAMNTGMWTAMPTRRNVEMLRADGYRFIAPGSGNLACGDVGEGRMAEPDEIIAASSPLLESANA